MPATWIEMCTCPEGYVGQYCESCAPGYRHSPSNGGPFAACIPCDCNSHADICDSETGEAARHGLAWVGVGNVELSHLFSIADFNFMMWMNLFAVSACEFE